MASSGLVATRRIRSTLTTFVRQDIAAEGTHGFAFDLRTSILQGVTHTILLLVESVTKVRSFILGQTNAVYFVDKILLNVCTRSYWAGIVDVLSFASTVGVYVQAFTSIS